jgi:sigma-B regulation protein RsbU (phosphoserine phosphatase)
MANLEPILAVAAKLAAPFDVDTMLSEVVEAAKSVLHAERGSVWLYDREKDELELRVAGDMQPLRIPAGTGIVGACARRREIINVPDCYADPRFDSSTDRRSGYRTRCLLTLPLVDHADALVGVMQVLNKAEGVFDADDEGLGRVLAAQCAVALQRARMTEALLEGERMRQQLEAARVIQMSALPAAMPEVAGYDLHGVSRPADLTGGDTFDLSFINEKLLVVLADATGHGIGPALSVTQMQAMLRMAFRLGAELEPAYVQVNNQLADTLPPDRFITAFIGLFDPATNLLRFHSGGQGPILLYRAARGEFVRNKPTSFPLAAMPMKKIGPAVELKLKVGDILALISDGVYEQPNESGEPFGEERVHRLIEAHHDRPMAELAAALLEAVKAFAGGKPQEDDMTIVLLKREPAATRAFARSFDQLEALFAFTKEHVGSEELRRTVDFVLEELFTNVVKYGRRGESPVSIDIRVYPGGVQVGLTDDDADFFDVTAAPEVDVNRPIEERRPGGLGIHLVRKLVDSIDYEYDRERRQARIVFRKTSQDAED